MLLSAAIVEDDRLFAEGVRELLDQADGFCCVGVCPSAEEALDNLPVWRPRVALVDIRLPGLSGIECVRRLKPALPDTEFMMLTVMEDAGRIFASLVAGATGYLLKGTPPQELLDAIRELAAGGSPMSPAIARKVVMAFRQPSPAPGAPEALSVREHEVLMALAAGGRYKEVAGQLGVSYDTVRTHVRHIYKKLQVHSRRGALERFGLLK